MKNYLSWLILIFLFTVPKFLIADTIPPSSDRDLMFQILSERKEKFSAYTESLEEKSGIFGGKTKKDFKRSQLVLVDIVKLDNRLISVLNRRLDFKNFEGVSQNYKQIENDGKVASLKQDLDVANNKLSKLSEHISDMNIALRQRNRLLVACGIIIVALFYFLRRKRLDINSA